MIQWFSACARPDAVLWHDVIETSMSCFDGRRKSKRNTRNASERMNPHDGDQVNRSSNERESSMSRWSGGVGAGGGGGLALGEVVTEIAQAAHGGGDCAVTVGQGAVEGVELVITFTGAKVGTIEQVVALSRHRLDGLRDGRVIGQFGTRGETAKDCCAERDGLIGFGQRDALVENVGIDLHKKWGARGKAAGSYESAYGDAGVAEGVDDPAHAEGGGFHQGAVELGGPGG